MNAERPLIRNSLVEKMFLRIANDAEMGEFVKQAESGATHRATAYASRKVFPVFEALVRGHERAGGNIEGIKNVVYRKDRNPLNK